MFAVLPPYEAVCLVVVRDLFCVRIEMQNAANASGNVREMHDACGQLPGFDIRIQLLLRAANAIEEVLMMSR